MVPPPLSFPVAPAVPASALPLPVVVEAGPASPRPPPGPAFSSVLPPAIWPPQAATTKETRTGAVHAREVEGMRSCGQTLCQAGSREHKLRPSGDDSLMAQSGKGVRLRDHAGRATKLCGGNPPVASRDSPARGPWRRRSTPNVTRRAQNKYSTRTRSLIILFANGIAPLFTLKSASAYPTTFLM